MFSVDFYLKYISTYCKQNINSELIFTFLIYLYLTICQCTGRYDRAWEKETFLLTSKAVPELPNQLSTW